MGGVGWRRARRVGGMWVADAGVVGYGRFMGVRGRFAGKQAATEPVAGQVLYTMPGVLCALGWIEVYCGV